MLPQAVANIWQRASPNPLLDRAGLEGHVRSILLRGMTTNTARDSARPRRRSGKWFWCIWEFRAGEDWLADRRPTSREAHMPYFKQFPVADESDGRRVCGRARAVGRRCTRTLV